MSNYSAVSPYIITILAIVVVVTVWLLRRISVNHHARFASPSHLAEMLEIVASLKQAALCHMEVAGQEAALPHPSCMLTSQEGVRVVYTITRAEEGYVHHFSLQTVNGPTPPPVGEMLMLFIATMLGFTEGRTSLERSPRGVYHGEITLTEEEQSEFAARAPVTRLYPE